MAVKADAIISNFRVFVTDVHVFSLLLQVGYDVADGVNFYSEPGSLTPNIASVANSTLAFRIDGKYCFSMPYTLRSKLLCK